MLIQRFEVEEISGAFSLEANDKNMESYFCGDSDFYHYERGGPIVAVRGDGTFIASMIKHAGRTSGPLTDQPHIRFG